MHPNQPAGFVRPPGQGLTPDGLDGGGLLAIVREGRRLLAEAGVAEGPHPCPGCARPVTLVGEFCAGCGARLRFPCPRCATTCRAGEGFCAGCGVELAERVVKDQLDLLAARAEAERLRRERDPLRAYETTHELASSPVRHVVGTRPAGGPHGGRREFVKLATSAQGKRLLATELWALDAIGAHPGVVELLERREHDGALVATFRHLEPGLLRYPLPIPRLLGLVRDVLVTLEHVHARGVVHADLKPKHIVIPRHGPAPGGDDDEVLGAPVLIDWNIAQAPGPSRTGAFTPLFAAPEQITGERVDARADLYALGVILYMLFTHDRFPAVLEEQAEAEPMLEVMQAKRVMNRAYLTEQTQYGGKLKSLQKGNGNDFGVQQNVMPQQRQLAMRPPSPAQDEGSEQRKVLGAKYLFSSELRRTHDVNAEIRLTGDVLAIVRKATALAPVERYADATSMRAAIEAALSRVAPAAGRSS